MHKHEFKNGDRVIDRGVSYICVGTVIDLDIDGLIRVKWPSGYINAYCSESLLLYFSDEEQLLNPNVAFSMRKKRNAS